MSTDTWNGYQATDHGAPVKQGSQAGAPSPTRRTRRPATTFLDGGVDELVAAACEDQVALLTASTADETATQRAGRLDTIARLEGAINKLRGER